MRNYQNIHLIINGFLKIRQEAGTKSLPFAIKEKMNLRERFGTLRPDWK